MWLHPHPHPLRPLPLLHQLLLPLLSLCSLWPPNPSLNAVPKAARTLNPVSKAKRVIAVKAANAAAATAAVAAIATARRVVLRLLQSLPLNQHRKCWPLWANALPKS